LVYGIFYASRRRHTRSKRDWSSDVCSSDLKGIFNSGGVNYDLSEFVKKEVLPTDKREIVLGFRPEKVTQVSGDNDTAPENSAQKEGFFVLSASKNLAEYMGGHPLVYLITKDEVNIVTQTPYRI